MTKQAALLDDVQLQPHQQRPAEDVETRPVRKLLVHQLGSGKSLSGINIAERAGQPYTAITPASLRPNYRKELAKFTDQKTPADVISYTQLAQGHPVPKDHTLIFDEAQTARNPGSERARKAVEVAQRSRNLVLLSGTPIVNRPSDLAPLISMLRKERLTPEEFNQRFVQGTTNPGWFKRLLGDKPVKQPQIKNPDELKALLRGHVDWYDSGKPVVPTTYEDVPVAMTDDQSGVYQQMWGQIPWTIRYKLKHDIALTPTELKRTQSFLTGPQQAGLSIYPYMARPDLLQAFQSSSKLQEANKRLQAKLQDDRVKALVFSSYIDAGLRPYGAALEQSKIPHGIFHGGLSDRQRKQLVEDYNTGKIRVALLGPSGTEGLSFKGTGLVQLLNSHWHGNRNRQAVGRGLRFDSHTELPDDLKNVQVQRFISRLQPNLADKLVQGLGFDRTPKLLSADDYLERVSKNKDTLNQQFMNVLREVGSEGKGAGDAGAVIRELRQAKVESDRRNYKAKHEILRKLLRERPHEFHIDSEDGGIVGLTHSNSGFRIHMPRVALPDPAGLQRVKTAAWGQGRGRPPVDVAEARKPFHGPYHEDHCPECGCEAVSGCRCLLNDRCCKNKHHWRRLQDSGEPVLVEGGHGPVIKTYR